MHTDIIFRTILLFALLIPIQAMAQQKCAIEDHACTTALWEDIAQNIDNESWRDQSYRELAKTLAAYGEYEKALLIWDKIINPDTKALTIRGIGMAAADNKIDGDAYNALFTKLREKSETITHPPSYAIALTYIAMAQAFAGDDAGAWKTAGDMENDALRHKAFGETAEIQAEKGKLDAAMKSIAYIDSEAYRNKSYAIVSKILADHGLYQESLDAAVPVTNAYKKAKAIEYVLQKQEFDNAHIQQQ